MHWIHYPKGRTADLSTALRAESPVKLGGVGKPHMAFFAGKRTRICPALRRNKPLYLRRSSIFRYAAAARVDPLVHPSTWRVGINTARLSSRKVRNMASFRTMLQQMLSVTLAESRSRAVRISNEDLMLKGEAMKKYTRVLVAITFLFGLGVAANAETRTVINVTLPFECVVGKTTLPAGTYAVRRITDQPFGALLIISYDNRAGVFVNPVETEDATAFKPSASFQKVGEQHFLSSIETAEYVYNFRVSSSVRLAAAAKPHDTVAVSGSGGGN
jgi:hypothetical protein